MLSLFIGFLTVFLTLNCVFLILVVLIQLPKKEAGLGTAFGGGMTDALFGAGTGNVLTKATKWSATLLLVLSLTLSILSSYQAGKSKKLRDQQLLQREAPAQVALPAAANNTTLPLQSTPTAPAAVPTTTTPVPAPTAPAPTGATAPASTPPASDKK